MNNQQELLQKYANALNDFNGCVKKNSHVTQELIRLVSQKHSVSNNLFYCAVQCGFFTKKDRGHYSVKLDRFDPYHARLVQNKLNENETDARNKKKLNSVKQEVKVKKTKPNKTISLLWGLIKITR